MLTNYLRKIPSLVQLRMGTLALCFSLLLVSFTSFSVSAHSVLHNAHSITTTAALNSPPKLKIVTSLGNAGTGVSMVSAKVGWALTFPGIQRSSDGGKTWSIVATGNQQEKIGPIYILDEQTLWYAAYDPQTFLTTALYRTNDGGKSWTRFASHKSLQDVYSVSLFDHQYAWVYARDNSSNEQPFHLFLVGGSSQSWKEVSLPGPRELHKIYFISQEVGWATEVAENIPAVDLYMTRNGGKSWKKQTLPKPAGVAAGSPSSPNVLGFANQLEGYLTTSFYDKVTSGRSAQQVYRTLDGGRSWQLYGDLQPLNVAYIARIDAWHLIGSYFVYLADQNIGVLKSGAWKLQHILLPPTGGILFTPLTDKVIFASGFSPDGSLMELYQTYDAGTTWQKIASIPDAF